MSKHRILFHSNPTHLKTGLATNSKVLLKHLYKTGKYDLAHYCSQCSIADNNLKLTPWKSFGCLPNDQASINQLNADPGKARDAAYGAWNIDNVINEWKPTIYLGSDDAWGFNGYLDKPWWNKINSALHITLDSLPILEQAYDQAKKTPHYFTWAKFAAKEMHRFGAEYQHVRQIYGAMDTVQFAPISDKERTDLRARFNISPNTVVFLFVGRNQLRKQLISTLESFAHFKRENPAADAKLHFHTSFSEKSQGWDIPKMAAYYGVKIEDILCTYVCKTCGQWHVASYRGEDIDCPYCSAKKSMITATIVNGVPDDQMRYVYGISDACVSAFSSGGQEYHNSQSLLCGKPLASTNYSSGADFCEQPFVYTLGFTTYTEHGTNFIKATTSIRDIKNYMVKVWKSSRRDLIEWGEIGRAWATKTFSIETIGAQWERVFDDMKPVDWSSISLTPEPKNDKYPFPQIDDEDSFISALYTNILKMNEAPAGDGFRHWKARLKDGMKREDIWQYFISVAQQDNAKIAPATQDFWQQIDKNGRKRGLILIKESIGDIILISSLFQSFHDQHKDTDLYVMADAKYHDLLIGNPLVHKVLTYLPAAEQEMLMMGAGQKPDDSYFDYFYHVALQTQRHLSYLSQPSPAFSVEYPAPLVLAPAGVWVPHNDTCGKLIT